MESWFLQIQLRLKSLQDNLPKRLDILLRTRHDRIIGRLLQSHQCEPEPDEGRELDSKSRDGPPSPLESWSNPSLESVGITSEEWVTRGWNVFFGAWG